MDQPTIVLLVGILCVFLGIFGGGFRIKEITIPKIGSLSRGMGAVFGVALIIWSQLGVKTNIVDIIENKLEPEVVDLNTKKPEPNEIPSPDSPNIQIASLDSPIPGIIVASKLDEYEEQWKNNEIDNQLLLAAYTDIDKKRLIWI